MITIKFLGGAKKLFSTEILELEFEQETIGELLKHLEHLKKQGEINLEPNNILVAVNGVDSSSLEGQKTKLVKGDTVSIIPIIHGGSKDVFHIGKHVVLIKEINKIFNFDYEFLLHLRSKFPKLIIQGFSSSSVLSLSHVQKILSISLEAKKNQILLSEKFETDFLLRLCGTNQISTAIKKTGITKGSDFVIFALGSRSKISKLSKELKPFIKEFSPKKRNQKFLQNELGITKNELNCIHSKTPLEDLLVERAAVLLG